jgi:hypothetical protein
MTCKCGQSLEVEEEFAGQTGECPSCGQAMRVPVPLKAKKMIPLAVKASGSPRGASIPLSSGNQPAISAGTGNKGRLVAPICLVLSGMACVAMVVIEDQSQALDVEGAWQFLKLALFIVLIVSMAVCVLRFMRWVQQTAAGRRLNSLGSASPDGTQPASQSALRREIPFHFLVIFAVLALAFAITVVLFSEFVDTGTVDSTIAVCAFACWVGVALVLRYRKALAESQFAKVALPLLAIVGGLSAKTVIKALESQDADFRNYAKQAAKPQPAQQATPAAGPTASNSTTVRAKPVRGGPPDSAIEKAIHDARKSDEQIVQSYEITNQWTAKTRGEKMFYYEYGCYYRLGHRPWEGGVGFGESYGSGTVGLAKLRGEWYGVQSRVTPPY